MQSNLLIYQLTPIFIPWDMKTKATQKREVNSSRSNTYLPSKYFLTHLQEKHIVPSANMTLRRSLGAELTGHEVNIGGRLTFLTRFFCCGNGTSSVFPHLIRKFWVKIGSEPGNERALKTLASPVHSNRRPQQASGTSSV